MHNDIMAACSKDRPPMLATGRYAQWQSRFMRYINTRPNCKELKKCIYDGPYVMTEILVPAKPTTATEEAVPAYTITETYKNTAPKKRAYFDVEVEAIHLILTGIGDDIYSTIDACTTAKEMWTTIKRLQQVNEIRAEKLARNANPLALVATAQHYPEYHNQEPKPYKSIAYSSKKQQHPSHMLLLDTKAKR
ncbi:hypothetical protein Tco_0869036 [Tanacetum coccineum]